MLLSVTVTPHLVKKNKENSDNSRSGRGVPLRLPYYLLNE